MSHTGINSIYIETWSLAVIACFKQYAGAIIYVVIDLRMNHIGKNISSVLVLQSSS